ncbi:unnamed protein product [Closterium sp. NIES-53]
MYLMTCTRPDLAYPLSLLAHYMAPGRHRKVHWDAAKRVLHYLCSTLGMGLVLGGRGPVVLTGHADASWVDDSATQRSSHGYTISLGSGSVSWRSTRLSSVLSSTCEAEIHAGAMAAQELHWLTYLLTDLGEQPRSPPVLYVDNKAMIALCQQHRLEHRTKHIALRYFLARELQQCGQLRLAYVATRANTADIFTKALPPGDHQRFSTVLGLLALLFLTGLVTTCSPPLCLWGERKLIGLAMECLAHRASVPVALATPKSEHRLPTPSASLKFAASPALGNQLVAKSRQAARASQSQLRRSTPRCETAPEGAALTAPEKKPSSDDTIQQFLQRDYKYGFVSNIENVQIPRGLSEETVRIISAKKREPEWMLEFRLSAFRQWQKMTEPEWSDNTYPKIDFQDVIYYSEPKQKETKASLDEVDPELLATFDKLGISISEQKRLANVAVDVVFDSVSIATTFREELAKAGVIFCSISEAVREYPDLVRKYLGKVVPVADNYYAALNSAVFSDGSFCYIPKDTISPMELSTYFRINAMETGQFERTLIVADDRSYVSYLEGCTAPSYDKNQLHAAVVELWTGEGAEIKYSTVQNWYAGDKDGVGGIYNFVTKRGLCEGKNSKISWTQVETGSAITWKYPSVVLKGDNSSGEFYSVALTNNKQQADTGTKMIHVGKNTRSRIVSKGISAGQSLNCYRGLVQVQPTAHGARNYSQCDSMLIGDNAGANTYPYIQVKDPTARVEHEASTSKIGEDQLFYFQQRGIDAEKAVGMLISGFCREVFNELPLEFASEVNQLMSLKLEGSVG